MRILLIKPYQTVGTWMAAPQLGLLYLTSSLRERFGSDVDVRILDMKVNKQEPDVLPAVLDEYRPDLVGVSAMNCEGTATRKIARIVKAHDAGIVTALGGPFAHKRGEELLRETEYDWTFDGPAERTFAEAIARRFQGDGDLGTDIAGLSYKRADGELQLSTGQDVVMDLDSIPGPAWDLVDFDLYAGKSNMMGTLKGKRYANLFTSRGCPYLCHYCHDLFTKKFVHRSAEHVLAEIELLYETYGVDEFHIVDDIFNLHKPRLRHIMTEVARRWPGKLHFAFPNGVRGDILGEAEIDLMAKAGTYAMCIAIETVTPRLQHLIEKNLKFEKAENAIRWADERGILTVGFFMLGFPTETREELDATVDFALRSKLTMAYFFHVIPQPATPLYELAKKEAPEALAATIRDEELSGGGYRGRFQLFYERAYDFPLTDFIDPAARRFYLRPGRALKIVRRYPPKSWGLAAYRLWKNVILGDGSV